MNRQLENPVGHHTGCTCLAEWSGTHFGRRRFLQVAAGSFAAAALAPWGVFAATGKYEAMILSCIDPRFQEPVCKFAAERHLTGKYSHFVIAGAAVGVVAPAFKDWHKAFWDNLAATIQLHSINRVIVINHRECGAAEIAYGKEAVTPREAETKTHREVLAEFRKELAERQPKLGVETGLMELGGKFEVMT
jgi:carbonic anhydrase-like protein